MSEDEIVIGGDAADIPDGLYPAKVAGIEVLHSVKFDSDFRAWTFRLDNGSECGGSSSLATGNKSKAGKWIKALIGHKPEQGEKVTLAGLPCVVRVEEDGDGWPRVIDVLPPQTANSTAASVPSDAAAADLPF